MFDWNVRLSTVASTFHVSNNKKLESRATSMKSSRAIGHLAVRI